MSPFTAEVAAEGVAGAVTRAQCAPLSLLSIVWLLSNGCEGSGREEKEKKGKD